MSVFANEKFNSNIIFNIIITTLIIMGVFLGFSPCIPSTNHFIYILMAISIVVAGISGILFSNIKYGKLIFVILAAAVFILLNPFALARGAVGIADRFIQLWNFKYEDAIPLYGIAHSSGDIQRLVIFFDILICPFIWYFVKGTYVLRTGIFMLAVSIVAHVLGSNMAMMSVFVFFICWICIWFRRVIGAYIFQAFIWTAVCMVIIAVMFVICPYNKIGTIDNFHNKLSDTVDNIRYGSDSLPKGKMEKAYNMLDNSEERLEVYSNRGKTLYLRGFVGERFKDGQWVEFPKSTYRGKNNGIFNWLEMNGFSPDRQYGLYASLCENPDNYENIDVSVKNTGAYRKYVYLPYSCVFSNAKMKTNNNGSMQFSAGIKGCENYEFSESSENLPSELLQNENWILNPQNEKQKKYMENEGIYRSFVYENYLNVPEDYKTLIHDMFWKNENTDINIYQASEHIRKVLYDNLSIVEVPQNTADNDDCLKWCLTKSREGNSVFFASAAVMAYRAVGIPARYAEGYFVGENDLIQGNGKAVITSENSHAWPEVYFDGMGWMPVDVTPGYYFDVFSLQHMLIQNKGSEELDESLQNFGLDIEESNDDFNNKNDIKEKELFTFLAFLGIITLIVVLLIIILILSELYRLLITGYVRCKYNKMNEKEKTVFVYKKITDFLQVCGISAVLGKDCHITDNSVVHKFSQISSGEYTRVYDLVEKTVYGDIELLPHEQRVIKGFFRKLVANSGSLDLKTRIKLRYYIPKIY